jgi:copper oxidase (laccase) domain-containing protein
MKFGINDNRLVRSNQESFFNNFGINVDDAVLCKVSYNTDKFTRYYEVDHSNFNKEADALVTKNNKIAIYLPLADCIGAIFFDDETNSIMISHLGMRLTAII